MSIKIGDSVRPRRTIYFIDDTAHYKEQEYLVTYDNVDYFNINSHDYTVVKSGARPLCDCNGWGCWGCCTSEQQIRSAQGTFS